MKKYEIKVLRELEDPEIFITRLPNTDQQTVFEAIDKHFLDEGSYITFNRKYEDYRLTEIDKCPYCGG